MMLSNYLRNTSTEMVVPSAWYLILVNLLKRSQHRFLGVVVEDHLMKVCQTTVLRGSVKVEVIQRCDVIR